MGGSYAPYPPVTDGVGFQDNLLINVTSTPDPANMSLLAVVAVGSGGLVSPIRPQRKPEVRMKIAH